MPAMSKAEFVRDFDTLTDEEKASFKEARATGAPPPAALRQVLANRAAGGDPRTAVDAEARARAAPMEKLQAFGAGAKRGAFFGLDRKIGGLAASLGKYQAIAGGVDPGFVEEHIPDAYEQGKRAYDQQQAEDMAPAPGYALAGEVTGGLLTSVTPGLRLIGASSGGLKAKAAAGALGGAGTAATYNMGQRDLETPEDVIGSIMDPNVLIGAGVGGVAAPALSAAASKVAAMRAARGAQQAPAALPLKGPPLAGLRNKAADLGDKIANAADANPLAALALSEAPVIGPPVRAGLGAARMARKMRPPAGPTAALAPEAPPALSLADDIGTRNLDPSGLDLGTQQVRTGQIVGQDAAADIPDVALRLSPTQGSAIPDIAPPASSPVPEVTGQAKKPAYVGEPSDRPTMAEIDEAIAWENRYKPVPGAKALAPTETVPRLGMDEVDQVRQDFRAELKTPRPGRRPPPAQAPEPEALPLAQKMEREADRHNLPDAEPDPLELVWANAESPFMAKTGQMPRERLNDLLRNPEAGFSSPAEPMAPRASSNMSEAIRPRARFNQKREIERIAALPLEQRQPAFDALARAHGSASWQAGGVGKKLGLRLPSDAPFKSESRAFGVRDGKIDKASRPLPGSMEGAHTVRQELANAPSRIPDDLRDALRRAEGRVRGPNEPPSSSERSFLVEDFKGAHELRDWNAIGTSLQKARMLGADRATVQQAAKEAGWPPEVMRWAGLLDEAPAPAPLRLADNPEDLAPKRQFANTPEEMSPRRRKTLDEVAAEHQAKVASRRDAEAAKLPTKDGAIDDDAVGAIQLGTRDGRVAIISPGFPQDGKRWRISMIDADGVPSGHGVHESIASALDDAADFGDYEIVDVARKAPKAPPPRAPDPLEHMQGGMFDEPSFVRKSNAEMGITGTMDKPPEWFAAEEGAEAVTGSRILRESLENVRLPRDRRTILQAILEENGIGDHDSARVNVKFDAWKKGGKRGPKPAANLGGSLDAWGEGVGSLQEGFDRELRGARTWADVERMLPRLAEALGVERLRLPSNVIESQLKMAPKPAPKPPAIRKKKPKP